MIRLKRGSEPAALASVRDGLAGELARVRAIGSPSSKEVGTKYRVVANDLWVAQHLKCAYCEGKEQLKRNDVEHFRPKGRIDAGNGSVLSPGYWWLAWHWTNLLFACRNCNQAPAKLDKFPIDPASTRLAAEDEPPGAENAMLVDPYAEDPMDHLAFKLAKVRGNDRWVPVPLTARGKRTIEILLLDRDDLLDLYDEHVTLHVEPAAHEVIVAIATANVARITTAWHRCLRVLQPPMPFAALAHDAIDTLVPRSVRDAHGLVLARPA